MSVKKQQQKISDKPGSNIFKYKKLLHLEDYKIERIDFEWCLTKKHNCFFVEISGLDNNKKIPSISIHLWKDGLAISHTFMKDINTVKELLYKIEKLLPIEPKFKNFKIS